MIAQLPIATEVIPIVLKFHPVICKVIIKNITLTIELWGYTNEAHLRGLIG